MITVPSLPLDYLWTADSGIDLEGNRVRRWKPIKGQDAFMEQFNHADMPTLGLAGAQGCLRFDRGACLHFRAFGAPHGPHTFVVVGRFDKGLLFDSQHGGPTVKAPKQNWGIYEITQDTSLPINGTTVLGANYYANADFMRGEISVFGYRRGILRRGEREYLYRVLHQHIGEMEKAFWTIRIPKPRWFK